MYRIMRLLLFCTFAVNSVNVKSEIITSVNKIDTISIVTDSKWVYYPFGKIVDMNAVKNTFRFCTVEFQEYSDNSFIIAKVTNKTNSEILFCKDRSGDGYDTTFLVVYADIYTNDLVINDCIVIGQSKSKVLDELGINKDIKANCIELISALDGCRITFTFNGNILSRISIKSDYDFSNDTEISKDFIRGLQKHGNYH